MKNISFDSLFESNLLKLTSNNGSSNSIKIDNLKKIVTKIINSELSLKQKQIIELYFVKQLSYSQIAQILKINKSTISRTKTRALKIISKILKYYFSH